MLKYEGRFSMKGWVINRTQGLYTIIKTDTNISYIQYRNYRSHI